MSNIDKQALREAAEKATPGPWRMALTKFNGITHGKFSFTKEDIIASSPEKRNAIFIAAANPATVLALLDEIAGLEQGHCGAALLEREESHAKTVGKLLDELEAKDKRIAEHRELLRWAHDTLLEINPSNYTHDDVREANAAAVEVILGIAPTLGETHGHTNEWWAARTVATGKGD